MKTYVANVKDIKRTWYVADAKDKTLGRFCTRVARILTGKDKPTFTPHVDAGDFVIVINAEKARVTGKKMTGKIYYHHTGYPGGLRQKNFRDMQAQFPERVIELAVKRMLPKNRMQAKRMKRLLVYSGETHPHQAQNPTVIEDSKLKDKRNYER
ncbi:MAG: 50S ribosomal protein L13 [Ignavibacteria bacterium]|nr:50S ribosomal protein L13 [Ignavibacteria bacterium]